jgi:hypothetical protein
VDSHVPLADAARSLRQSREKTLRQLLRGRLDGMKQADRWFVSVASIQRLSRELGKAEASADACTQ